MHHLQPRAQAFLKTPHAHGALAGVMGLLLCAAVHWQRQLARHAHIYTCSTCKLDNDCLSTSAYKSGCRAHCSDYFLCARCPSFRKHHQTQRPGLPIPCRGGWPDATKLHQSANNPHTRPFAGPAGCTYGTLVLCCPRRWCHSNLISFGLYRANADRPKTMPFTRPHENSYKTSVFSSDSESNPT